jgi:hypothetical protein
MLSRIAVAAFLLGSAFAAEPAPVNLTVHEWGTFTSVAGENGAPVSWVSLAAPSDLPCFVHRLSAQCVKCNATSTVRMETPVLYFYSPQPATASVHVEIPRGVVTEWYPKATGLPKDSTYGNDAKMDWQNIRILPGVSDLLRDDGSNSHYYPARQTDSAIVDAGGQREKFLFYRGVINDGVFLEAVLSGEQVRLRNVAAAPIPFAAIFENREGKIGFRVVRDLAKDAALDLPELTADREAMQRELASALTDTGLYEKEAAAMIETWRDTWFEDGMVRAFVGRVELFSPATRSNLQTALTTGDIPALARCGRFLAPFAAQIMAQPGVRVHSAAHQYLDEARAPGFRVAPCTAPPPPVTEQQ